MIALVLVTVMIMTIDCNSTNFPTSELIKETNLTDLLKDLTHGELSLILIYSPSCPHCVRFHPHFVGLSEEFKGKARFYQINARESKDYRKQFEIRGFPSLWFYYNGSFSELPSNYNKQYISDLIETRYIFDCTEVAYEKAKEMLLNSSNELDDSVIGLFNCNESLAAYVNATRRNREYLRKCFNAYNKELNQSIVYSKNKQKGINAFNLLNYTEKASEKLFHQLKCFIQEKVTGLFVDFKGEEDLSALNSLNTQVIIFSYHTIEEKGNYIQLIKDIHLQYRSSLICSFVVFDVKSNVRALKSLSFAQTAGVYLSDSKYTNITKVTDIEALLASQTLIETNHTHFSMKSTGSLINNDTLKQLVNHSAYEPFILAKYYKEMIYALYIIVYSMLFCLLWKCFLRKSLEEEEVATDEIADIEEMKGINE